MPRATVRALAGALGVSSGNARIPAGLAVLPSITIMADVVASRDGRRLRYTEFHIHSAAGWITLRVRGGFFIEDYSRGTGVFMYAPEPLPHVFVVRDADLLSAIAADTLKA